LCPLYGYSMRLTSSFLVVFLLTGTAIASDELEYELTGYYKNLVLVRDAGDIYGAGSSTLLDNYERFRLKFRLDAWDWFEADVDYEVLMSWGDTIPLLRTLEEQGLPGAESYFGMTSLQARPRFFDMESEITSSSRFRLGHQVDRFRMRAETDSLELSVGRQSVTWGRGLIWSPTDLFAGFSPTEVDRDEKLGVDVVRLLVWPTTESLLDLVCEPLDFDASGEVQGDDSAVAGRFSTHCGEYDLSVCGGYVAGDWVAGGDFSGYLGDGGLRGEFLYVSVREVDEDDYVRLMLGCDYSFQAAYQPYLTLEYYYNGIGSSYEAGYLDVLELGSFRRVVTRGTMYNVGTHYAGSLLALTITPLMFVQNRAIVNLEDSSVNEYLSLSYSLSANSELIFGVSINMGDRGTELGGWSKSGLVYYKGHF